MNHKLLCLILGAIVLAACAKKEEPAKPAAAPAPAPAPTAATPPPVSAGVTVAMVSLGKAIGGDKKVSAATESFAKDDTIYASVDTLGTGTVTLKARWTYHKNGQVAIVKEDTQTVAPAGPATTEFHISKPGGWPAGDYQVEVFLGDASAGVKKFVVK